MIFMKFTAIIKKGEKQYVALCPEIDIVSQGYTLEEAIQNLREAVELYVEVEGLPEGVSNEDTFVTSIEVTEVGKASKAVG